MQNSYGQIDNDREISTSYIMIRRYDVKWMHVRRV